MTSTARKSTAPRKTAAKKTTTSRPRNDTPAPVGFNFDTASEEAEPFPVVLGGKRYESLDPMEFDFRVLADFINGDPEMTFRLLFPDDADEMLENHISIRALSKFNEAAADHFGLADFIAARS
ncbi:hypothetical protein [Nocardioides bruguierae]|uniref:Tail assembly chaperone n=1 Tax=Nocardioides bruguierae TaxID=2945102 RepID=A0A9X2DAS4_9ACTN|nr:hypothetical protein [Nocardioides bruguierae]MCM0622513.1 hypothetical protein [Nocardioides bruguierae]